MTGLRLSAAERRMVATFLNTQFNIALAANRKELMLIHDVVKAISIMQNVTVKTNQASASTITSAQNTISQSVGEANRREHQVQNSVKETRQLQLDAYSIKQSSIRRQEKSEELKVTM